MSDKILLGRGMHQSKGNKNLIITLFPNIIPWATSGGVLNPDFYVVGVVPSAAYMDVGGNPAPAPAPIVTPVVTSCVPAGP